MSTRSTKVVSRAGFVSALALVGALSTACGEEVVPGFDPPEELLAGQPGPVAEGAPAGCMGQLLGLSLDGQISTPDRPTPLAHGAGSASIAHFPQAGQGVTHVVRFSFSDAVTEGETVSLPSEALRVDYSHGSNGLADEPSYVVSTGHAGMPTNWGRVTASGGVRFAALGREVGDHVCLSFDVELEASEDGAWPEATRLVGTLSTKVQALPDPPNEG